MGISYEDEVVRASETKSLPKVDNDDVLGDFTVHFLCRGEVCDDGRERRSISGLLHTITIRTEKASLVNVLWKKVGNGVVSYRY